MIEPYDYQDRDGIRPISWADFHGLCKALAHALQVYDPGVIVAVGRGGYYPGTLIAHILQAEILPVRISRRVNDLLQFDQPQWIVEPQPALLKDQRVAIVDEICDSGETLQIVQQKVQQMGSAEVRSAVLYAHSWKAFVPDYIGIITDELILNPWDREILVEGIFQFHPEYLGALEEQSIEPEENLHIQASQFTLAKGAI